jgi:hypothetical protein
MNTALAARVGPMDSAKAAGLITIGALVVLALMRKGFHGVRIGVGD